MSGGIVNSWSYLWNNGNLKAPKLDSKKRSVKNVGFLKKQNQLQKHKSPKSGKFAFQRPLYLS